MVLKWEFQTLFYDISHILYSSRQQGICYFWCHFKCQTQYICIFFLKTVRREELNEIHLTPSFSVQLVITSFTGWFLTQKSYVSELMKVIHASLSDLFQDWSVTCWRCCWFKFRSCWIMPCRLYPGKVIIEVPLKSTR